MFLRSRASGGLFDLGVIIGSPSGGAPLVTIVQAKDGGLYDRGVVCQLGRNFHEIIYVSCEWDRVKKTKGVAGDSFNRSARRVGRRDCCPSQKSP